MNVSSRRGRPIYFRPIGSVPGAKVTLIDRVTEDNYRTFKPLDSTRTRELINLGSYNYLGYAENKGMS